MWALFMRFMVLVLVSSFLFALLLPIVVVVVHDTAGDGVHDATDAAVQGLYPCCGSHVVQCGLLFVLF